MERTGDFGPRAPREGGALVLPRALGGREAAREELATMPIDLHRRARTRSGWINGWKWMFYWDTFFVL